MYIIKPFNVLSFFRAIEHLLNTDIGSNNKTLNIVLNMIVLATHEMALQATEFNFVREP